jgi:hypothetical protein
MANTAAPRRHPGFNWLLSGRQTSGVPPASRRPQPNQDTRNLWDDRHPCPSPFLLLQPFEIDLAGLQIVHDPFFRRAQYPDRDFIVSKRVMRNNDIGISVKGYGVGYSGGRKYRAQAFIVFVEKDRCCRLGRLTDPSHPPLR